MSLYLVCGRWAYREHQPGEMFEAVLPPDMEERAVAVGAIEVLERSTSALQPGSFTLPAGWPITTPDKEG